MDFYLVDKFTVGGWLIGVKVGEENLLMITLKNSNF